VRFSSLARGTGVSAVRGEGWQLLGDLRRREPVLFPSSPLYCSAVFLRCRVSRSLFCDGRVTNDLNNKHIPSLSIRGNAHYTGHGPARSSPPHMPQMHCSPNQTKKLRHEHLLSCDNTHVSWRDSARGNGVAETTRMSAHACTGASLGTDHLARIQWRCLWLPCPLCEWCP